MIEYVPKEYNVDQEVIPRVQLIFLCIYVALLGISLYYVISQRRHGLKCQILEFFSIILIVFIISLSLFISNWIYIIRNGNKEIPYVDLFGNLFYIMGDGMFLLLLIIIGQGWTQSVHYGQNIFQRILNYLITFSMIGLSWAIYIMYIYKSDILDDDNSYNQYLYFLDTIPGYILASLYIVIMGFFIFSNHLYRQDEIDESKKKLTFIFTWVFISWFIIHPIVIIISHFIDPYMKYIVVTIINLGVNTIFFTILVYLFRPKLNNQSGHFLIAGGELFHDDYDEEEHDHENVNENDDESLRNHASSSGKSDNNLKKESIFNSIQNIIKNHSNSNSSNNSGNNSSHNSTSSIDINDNNSTSSITNNNSSIVNNNHHNKENNVDINVSQ